MELMRYCKALLLKVTFPSTDGDFQNISSNEHSQTASQSCVVGTTLDLDQQIC